MRFNQFDIAEEVRRATSIAKVMHGVPVDDPHAALRACVAAYALAVSKGEKLPSYMVAAFEQAKRAI